MQGVSYCFIHIQSSYVWDVWISRNKNVWCKSSGNIKHITYYIELIINYISYIVICIVYMYIVCYIENTKEKVLLLIAFLQRGNKNYDFYFVYVYNVSLMKNSEKFCGSTDTDNVILFYYDILYIYSFDLWFVFLFYSNLGKSYNSGKVRKTKTQTCKNFGKLYILQIVWLGIYQKSP